ncbi:MAG TPA: HAMP domain-containing sensor histidine kinase [Acidimicrobiales bacterium]|nr:HAMP domain-containing sensor histidine kinase [Acidimicrobiales bacterium]
MTLRARILVSVVALSLAGLVVADAATWTALRSFLLGRVDEQLVSAQAPVLRALATGGGLGDRDLGRVDPRITVPPGTYGQVRDSSGSVLVERQFGYEGQSLDAPKLPADLSRSKTVAFTTSAYRVLVAPLTLGAGGSGFLVVAIPLHDVNQTLGRLLVVMLVATALVVLGLAALSWWVVRRDLRPLERIEGTAGAIAAGDLSRRVETTDPRTEVGRLGVALNAMLTRIEQAFAERQASEDRLRRFLADASHELRTPLTSIRGYAELFRRGADRRPDDLAKAMRRIEEEAERMGVMVDDLLLLARLDQGRPLEQAPVDLATLAADAVADARVADPGRPITLDASAAVHVLGDVHRLRQVASNLVANALAHTPPATPVRVSARAEGADGVLEVADSGPGLSADEAAHVFERFYRGDPSRVRHTGGTGLGLAIVAAIASAHGGRAEVASTPGGGATFRVRLPRSVARVPTPAPSLIAPAHGDAGPGERSPFARPSDAATGEPGAA